MRNVGERICAVLKADKENVHLIGYGIYAGDYVPGEEAVGVMANALKNAKIKNPKLVMDDGTVVWGCECWWGNAGMAERMILDRNVVKVDMKDVRKEYV